MRILSDPTLSTVNVLLQWLAIAGTALGLLSAIGLIPVRRELSDRQHRRLLQARQEASTARQLADSLQQRLQPRRLTAQQKNRLVNLLQQAPKGNVTIMAIKMDNEATIFAQEISSGLTSAGFPVNDYSGPLILSITPGVWVQVHSQASPLSASAVAVRDALQAIGISCTLSVNPEVPDSSVLLGVGPKE